jgi:Ser/Thr protein kinase RdoA (MazF antagonist)
VRVDRPPELLSDLGAFLARVAEGFTGFDHPAAGRHLQWDVAHGADVLSHYLPEVTADRRPLVGRALSAFERHLGPALETLPRSVIHNDANDHNVVVAGERVTGLIDFGDMVRTVTLNELAVGCAYAGLGQPDPWQVMEVVAEGHEAVRRLSEQDRALLPHLVRTRLATSVAISAHQQALAPDDAYLTISEAPAWRSLAAFDQRLEST